MGFQCARCGEWHDELPMAFAAEAPAYWEQAYVQTWMGPYSSTLGLEAELHTQPIGVRPLVELAPSDHPLAREQREGIDMARVAELAAAAMHP